jgi:acyl carrier protein
MTSQESTYDALCRLLQPFNTAGVALSPQTDISGDLNIDSVSVMDFVMEVEDHFNIDIPLNVLSETRTLADLVAVVESRVNKGS